MSFEALFAGVVRVTGWGLGVYVIVAEKVGPTETVGLILAFVGFEFVSRAKERVLPGLTERKRNGQS